jgi:hypothetical protein
MSVSESLSDADIKVKANESLRKALRICWRSMIVARVEFVEKHVRLEIPMTTYD